MPAAGKAWAADGVTVVAVGVTDGIDKQGLIDIAGAEERALQVKSFDEIATLATSLLKKVCKAGNLRAIILSNLISLFLDASSHLYLRVCPSVCQSVCPSDSSYCPPGLMC